ncbi:MAG: ABC transporter substrate-binding protein [Pseudodesulfovibrio sp.]
MSQLKHITLLLLLSLCSMLAPANANALERTSIVLQWLPQAQFAGIYMAQDMGFYEEAGIDLTILSGGPDVLASEYLESGKAEFATLFLTTGLHRRATLPIVNIGQFVQHSSLMLITRKDSGIERLEDLGGKKVGLWANEFQIQARILFKKKGLKVTVVPQSDSLDLFLRGGVAAASGMWYNEYHTLLSYGMEESELQPFFYSDYGLDFPEDGIYCLEKVADEKPELCRALVEATARGWMYAFNHTEDTIDSVIRRMKEAKVPANRSHQRWMLKRMEDLIISDDYAVMGVLHPNDYQRVRTALKDHGFIDSAPLFPDFYRGPR